jgi:mono/diheme cytochrome c family protein
MLAATLTATSTAVFAQGTAADTYKSKCAMCHGADGMASGPAGKAMNVPPITAPAYKAPEADLIAVTKAGKGKMPPFASKLTDTQIKEVVAYMHTLQK